MTQAPAFSKTGAKREAKVKLDAGIFGVEANQQLVAQAYDHYLANGRLASAVVLKRGEVRGGGRKPWRQKGTGRARFGSSRVPQWRGGGITFGPTGQENYTRTLPVKAKRAAIRQALSLQAEHIWIIEALASPEGKVKPMADLLTKIGATGRILVAVDHKDELIDRATRNLPGIVVVQANYLNVYDIMNADTILISEPALDMIQTWLSEQKPATPTPSVTKTATKKEATK